MTLVRGRRSAIPLFALLAAALGACTVPNPQYRRLLATDASGADASARPDGFTMGGDGMAPDTRSVTDARLPPDQRIDAVADAGEDAAGTVVTRGLSAYWRFDEGAGATTSDSTGNGNSGTLVNNPTWVAGGFPGARFPNAGSLAFDGVDDYVEFQPRTLPRSSTPKAVSLWLWLESTPDTRRQSIVVMVNDDVGAAVQVGLDQGRIAAWHLQPPIPRVVASQIATAGWHHVVWTFDGVTERLYVDRVEVDSVDGNPANETHPVLRAQAGSEAGASRSELFEGRVDDVRIYSRALEESEIVQIGSGQ